MATKSDKTDITTKTARARLRVQPAAYPRALKPKQLTLLYSKTKAGEAGKWITQTYLGLNEEGKPRHTKKNIGIADDLQAPDGEHILTFTQAQQKALDTHDKQLKAKKAGTHTGPLTVQDVTTSYLRHLKAHGQPADHAERRIRVHILPALGRLQVDELTTHRLVRWRDAMAAEPARLRTAKDKPQRWRDAPLTPDEQRARRATVNRTVTVLKAALNRAFKAGRLHDDTAWRRLEPFGKVDVARPGFLSPQEAQRLINAAPPDFRAVVRAALYTGARYGELCRLVVADFQRNRLVIRKSKSGKPRDIRLQEEAVAFFQQLTLGRPSGETLLLRPDAQPWGPSHQARPMRAACEAAKLTPIGIHQLRHTWASQAVMSGLPLLLVAENLGHADTRMVEKHYGHLTQSYKDEMFAKHAPRFGSPEESNIVPMEKAG